MRLLVLGGTGFVGRTVVTMAVEGGWSVTTLNRGQAAWHHPLAERLFGDRLEPAGLAQLQQGRWDAVVDTWAGAPRVVRDSARLLADRVDRYLYVSTRSVYALPTPHDMDESSPTVAASPDAEATEYAENKRGAELAIEAALGGDRSVFARAGLILGPLEDVGRLPHWLRRMERGGEVLAPGPPDLTLQYVDVRDLAAWLLDAAQSGVSGPVNIVNPAGHATWRGLLEAAAAVTGRRAELVWVDPETIAASDIVRWTELPGWIAPEPQYAGLHTTNVAKALATGLRNRPVEQTVADTWAWLQTLGDKDPLGPGRAKLGLDPEKERRVISAYRGAGTVVRRPPA